MPDTIKATIILRDVKHEGLITDSDGLLFLSSLMNAHETNLLNAGRLTEAGELLQARFNARKEELIKEGKDDAELITEISQTMLYKVERDPEERSRIAARIKERFPTIPDSLVRWETRSNYAINLHLEELMQLIAGIIGPALEQFKKLTPTPKNEKPIEKTKTSEKTTTNKKVASLKPTKNNTKISPKEAASEIIELEAKIEEIRKRATTPDEAK